jgi:hypothetical protein
MKLSLTLLLILLAAALIAAPVTPAQARQAAQAFLDNRQLDHQIADVRSISDRGAVNAYIMELNAPGFIAVSGDDLLPPVLAYSLRESFDFSSESILSKMIQRDTKLRLTWLAQNNAAPDARWANPIRDGLRTFQQWPADGSTTTDGWILKRWDQSGVFNRMCPMDTETERSVVGCVATAMSMIVDFHQWVGDVSFDQSDAYVSGWWTGIHIDGDAEEHDFPTFPELNGYLETLAQDYAAGNELSNDDLASLCFACGISVQMSYAFDGSGAYTQDVVAALLNKFGFDSADWIEYDESTLGALADEAKNMRPTEMSIVLEDWSNGHAINCDGYNTDNFYHLNFGWGSSDPTCWYTLPEGMPSNYCIITGAVVNAEAGVHPVAVQGGVTVSGVPPTGAYIRLEGPWTFEWHVTTADGQFTLPAVYPGTYTATAMLDNRLYYDSQTVVIDATHHTLAFNLGEYEAITGQLQAEVSVAGAAVNLYGGETQIRMSTATAANDGSFSFPDQFPGQYFVTASLPGGYWGQTEFDYSIDNQSVTLNLTREAGEIGYSVSGAPSQLFHLPSNYTISCAIRLTADQLTPFQTHAIAGVRFKAPANADACTLSIQVWEDGLLAIEQPVTGFTSGQWITSELLNYIAIRPDHEYLVGYNIHSDSGDMIWSDSGPRIPGHGAYFRSINWTELPLSQHDYNFCIDAVIRSDDFGVINGAVSLTGGNGDAGDVVVWAGNYTARADQNGDYSLVAPPGQYALTASLDHFENAVSPLQDLASGQTVDVPELTLQYDSTGIGSGNSTPSPTMLLGNSPNPFNPETSIRFSLSGAQRMSLAIYDVRGRLVRTLLDRQAMSAGEHRVSWNGTDARNQSVASGVYFATMFSDDGKFTSTKKMILLK